MTTYTWTQFNAALVAGIEMTAEAAEQETAYWPFPAVRLCARGNLANAAWPSEMGPFTDTGADDALAAFTFEFDQISRAVNGAVDEVAARKRRCANDRDNLLVNAILTVLKEPGADLDDVADECYGEAPDTVAGWARDAA